jgi:hypothetical protein
MASRLPVAVKVISLPCVSAREARQSAVALLKEEIGRQLAHSRKGPNVHVQSAQMQERMKENLLLCDTNITQYAYPLPSWASLPFAATAEHRSTTNCKFLYELILQTESGRSLMGHYLNIDECNVTRIGILFPADIQPSYPTCESMSVNLFNFVSQFINPAAKGDAHSDFGIARAKLVNRTVVCGHFDPLVLEGLQLFNRSLVNWKTYGSLGGAEVNPTGDVFYGRTYVVTPLMVDPMDVSGSLTIDYDMYVSFVDFTVFIRPNSRQRFIPCLSPASLTSRIRRELDKSKRALLVNTNCTWRVPVFGDMDSRSVTFISLLLSIAVTPMNYLCGEPVVPTWEGLLAFFLLLLSTIATCMSSLQPDPSMPFEALANFFLWHRGILYITTPSPKSDKTAWSSFPDNIPRASQPLERSTGDFGLGIRIASFKDYYLQKYGFHVFSLVPFTGLAKIENNILSISHVAGSV